MSISIQAYDLLEIQGETNGEVAILDKHLLNYLINCLTNRQLTKLL